MSPMERRTTQPTNGNCHIAETGAGEGVIVLTLRRVQWMKICTSLEEAARIATDLKIIESDHDLMSGFHAVHKTRGCWCDVPDDYDVKALLTAGFSYVAATK
jgi:hypothetical protein